MAPQNILALTLLLFVAGWFVYRIRSTPTVQPEPRTKRPTYRCHGAHCGRRAHYRDWHIGDGAWVHSCPGCHDLGHYMGWLAHNEQDAS